MPLTPNEVDDIFTSFGDKAKRHGTVAAFRRPRFTLQAMEAVTMTNATSYLVKGIIPRAGLAVVWGPPKCGKSFWTYDLVMHIALGREYCGHHVQQGTVVYLALEGGYGFRNRVEAWRRYHLGEHREPVPFYLLDVPVDLVADCVALIQSVKAQLTAPPAVVVIDTLNRALIGDENKSDDMARFIRAVDMIRAAFGCVVIIIHHCGVAGNRPRGHTSLSGADDVQIAIERNGETGIVAVKVEHMKDGDASAPMACRLDRVELGTDTDGDAITSCIVMPAEGENKRPQKNKIKGPAKIAFDLLARALADAGEPAPTSNHIPKGSVTIPVELWRRYCYEGTIAEGSGRDTKRQAFHRALKRLQELGAIGIWSDRVWLA